MVALRLVFDCTYRHVHSKDGIHGRLFDAVHEGTVLHIHLWSITSSRMLKSGAFLLGTSGNLSKQSGNTVHSYTNEEG